VAVKSVHCRKD